MVICSAQNDIFDTFALQSAKFLLLFDSRAFIVAAGIGAFVLSKQSIDAKRLENLKIRQRMRDANKGDFKSNSGEETVQQ